MATYNNVYIPTKFSSVENAKKKDKKSQFSSFGGKVYRSVYTGAIRGKIKDYVTANNIGYNSYGTDYNGYGYGNQHRDYYLDAQQGRGLLELLNGKKEKTTAHKTFEQVREAWAQRLVRLLSGDAEYSWVTIDVARAMADEKAAYKQKQIEKVEERQVTAYSVKRATLIRKMERENPLRYIKDVDHARAIAQASRRHTNTDYETLLDYYRGEARCGEVGRDEVKQLARTHYSES